MTTLHDRFKIVAQNEERGQPKVSYVRSLRVYLPHFTVIELQKNGRVLVSTFLHFHFF